MANVASSGQHSEGHHVPGSDIGQFDLSTFVRCPIITIHRESRICQDGAEPSNLVDFEPHPKLRSPSRPSVPRSIVPRPDAAPAQMILGSILVRVIPDLEIHSLVLRNSGLSHGSGTTLRS